VLEVSLGSFYPEKSRPASVPEEEWGRLGQRLFVRMNGVTVLDSRQAFHPSAPADIRVGENPIGASTAQQRFGGEIVALGHEDPAALGPASGPR